MEKSRFTQPYELAEIKFETRNQYFSSQVTRQQIIQHTRVESSDLTKYGDDNEPKRYMPVDVLVDVTRITGNPALLRKLNELCGYEIVPKYDDDAPPGTASDATMLHVTAEFGDLVREYMTGKQDGHLDLLDKQRIRREGHQAVAAILNFLRGL
jgi:hypothetical protein